MNCLNDGAFYLITYWFPHVSLQKEIASKEPIRALPWLPGEILEGLFDDFSIKNLAKTALVSKKWNKLTQNKLHFCKPIFMAIKFNMHMSFPIGFLRNRQNLKNSWPHATFPDPDLQVPFKIFQGIPQSSSQAEADIVFYLKWVDYEIRHGIGVTAGSYPSQIKMTQMRPLGNLQKIVKTFIDHIDNILQLRTKDRGLKSILQ